MDITLVMLYVDVDIKVFKDNDENMLIFKNQSNQCIYLIIVLKEKTKQIYY